MHFRALFDVLQFYLLSLLLFHLTYLHIYLEGSDLVTLSPKDETCLRVLYIPVVSEITNGQNPN